MLKSSITTSDTFTGVLQVRGDIEDYKATRSEAILTALDDYDAINIFGPSRSGKSTSIPEFISKSGYRVIVVCPSELAVRYNSKFLCTDSSYTIKKCKFRTNQSLMYMTQSYAKTLMYGYYEKLMSENTRDSSPADVIVIDDVHKTTIDITIIMSIWRYLKLHRRSNIRLVMMSRYYLDDLHKRVEPLSLHVMPVGVVVNRPVIQQYIYHEDIRSTTQLTANILSIINDCPCKTILVYLPSMTIMNEAARVVNEDILHQASKKMRSRVEILSNSYQGSKIDVIGKRFTDEDKVLCRECSSSMNHSHDPTLHSSYCDHNNGKSEASSRLEVPSLSISRHGDNTSRLETSNTSRMGDNTSRIERHGGDNSRLELPSLTVSRQGDMSMSGSSRLDTISISIPLHDVTIFTLHSESTSSDIRAIINCEGRRIIMSTPDVECISIEDVDCVIDSMMCKMTTSTSDDRDKYIFRQTSRYTSQIRASNIPLVHIICSEKTFSLLDFRNIREIDARGIHRTILELMKMNVDPMILDVDIIRVKNAIMYLASLSLIKAIKVPSTLGITTSGLFCYDIMHSLRSSQSSAFLYQWIDRTDDIIQGAAIASIIDCYSPYIDLPYDPDDEERPEGAQGDRTISSCSFKVMTLSKYRGDSPLDTCINLWNDIMGFLSSCNYNTDQELRDYIMRYCKDNILKYTVVAETVQTFLDTMTLLVTSSDSDKAYTYIRSIAFDIDEIKSILNRVFPKMKRMKNGHYKVRKMNEEYILNISYELNPVISKRIIVLRTHDNDIGLWFNYQKKSIVNSIKRMMK